jgi:hypothetical protein
MKQRIKLRMMYRPTWFEDDQFRVEVEIKVENQVEDDVQGCGWITMT